jgi:hypothetical protein
MKITEFSVFSVNKALAFVPLQGFVSSQIFANFAELSYIYDILSLKTH